MLKFFIGLLLLNTSAIAQRSITASYSSRGILPTSGYITITEDGIKKSFSKKDLPKQHDSTVLNTSTLKNSTAMIFVLVDSIVVYQNKVKVKPSICGGYGLTSWFYNDGITNKQLFCVASMAAYDKHQSLIKKEKNNLKKQQLIQQLKDATILYNLYMRLNKQFNTII